MNDYLILSSYFPHIIGQTPFVPSVHSLGAGEVAGFPHVLASFRSPSFVPATLLENHWAWWVVAFGMGVLVVYLGWRGNDRRVRIGGLGVLAAAFLWVIAAQVFDTPGERLHRAHMALAEAAGKGDVDGIVEYLAPDVAVSAESVHIDASDKAHISEVLKELGIKESVITSYSSTMGTDGAAFTTIQVITTMEMGKVPTGWRLRWRDMPGSDWKITNAQYVQATLGPPPPGTPPTR